MNYDDWVKTVPTEIVGDSLWKVEAYRISLFANDIGWYDVTKLTSDRRMVGLSDQLYRALGSICANIAEGYSRRSGREKARFYEYALGSVRESRGWYYNARHILGEKVISHRINLLTQIIRLLTTMVPDQRTRTLHESKAEYINDDRESKPDDLKEFLDLLQIIPLP